MPPTNVHGFDTFTAMEIAVLRSEVEDPGYPSRYLRVPMVGDTQKLERESLSEPQEITPSGAVTFSESGPGRWRGTFTTLCYYNAQWFHWLMCQVHGGLEIVTPNVMPSGVASPGVAKIVNTHTYLPQSFRETAVGSSSAVPWGLALRLSKMGPNNSAGTIQKVLAVRVMECVIEHREGDWLTATWTVEGGLPVNLAGAGVTPMAQVTTEYPVKPGDLSRDNAHSILPSLSEVGVAVLGAPALRGWSLRMNNGLVFPANMLTAFDTAMRPGHGSDWEVTSDVRNALTDTSLDVTAGGMLHWAHMLGVASNVVRLRYTSAKEAAVHSVQSPLADATEDIPYAFEIAIVRARITQGSNPIEGGGALQDNYTLQVGQGVADAADFALTADHTCTHLISMAVADADEPTPEAKFSTAAEGGNNAHATLLP